MKLVQVGSGKKSRGFLRVDEFSFAELVKFDDKFMTFAFTYYVIPEADSSYREYDRVVIEVNRNNVPDITDIPTISSYATTTDGGEGFRSNTIGGSSIEYAVPQPVANKPRTYPYETAQKIFAGRILLDALNKRSRKIASITSMFGADLAKMIDKNFSTVEVNRLPVKKVLNSDYSIDSMGFDFTNLVRHVNKFRYDPTSPATENVTSEKMISGAYTLRNYNSINRQFHEAYTKYLLLGIPGSPDESSHSHYETVRKITKISKFRFVENVKIPVQNNGFDLKVTFSLYKKDELVPSEIVEKTLNTTSHYSAYKNIKDTLSVDAHDSGKITSLTISCDDASNFTQYNVYLKRIHPTGEVTDFELIRSLSASSLVRTEFQVSEGIKILRVAPVDINGTETGIFKDVVVGTPHNHIGSFTIFPYYSAVDKKISIELFNIPVGTTRLYLYRRNCTQNSEEPFSLVMDIPFYSTVTNYRIYDPREITHGDIFEYYASAISCDNGIQQKYVSNYFFLRHPLPLLQKKAINVKMTNFVSEFSENTQENVVSFVIETDIAKEGKQYITDTLVSQLGEMYSLYLDPANNLSSPLGEDKYADLVVHEIVRTNLSSGERDVYRIVPNGSFFDNSNSQSTINAPKVNSRHRYVYQIFSFQKNPILLFKDYIAYGVDISGKEWYFSPYKWRQPRVLALGKLYPDDSSGKPIIDGYEALTSEPLGLSSTQFYTPAIPELKIRNVIAERVDRNTISVKWDVDSIRGSDPTYVAMPDTFILMKVVNGVRSFLGKTTGNYFFHDVTEEDLGTIYYIVVPIDTEYKLGTQGYSSPLFIESAGIVDEKLVMKG